jgi:hypothetical protein
MRSAPTSVGFDQRQVEEKRETFLLLEPVGEDDRELVPQAAPTFR